MIPAPQLEIEGAGGARWGLTVHMGMIVAMQRQPGGDWTPMSTIPAKLAEYIDTFAGQHQPWLMPAGMPSPRNNPQREEIEAQRKQRAKANGHAEPEPEPEPAKDDPPPEDVQPVFADGTPMTPDTLKYLRPETVARIARQYGIDQTISWERDDLFEEIIQRAIQRGHVAPAGEAVSVSAPKVVTSEPERAPEKAMDWHTLRTEAKKRGIPIKNRKRAAIEADVLAKSKTRKPGHFGAEI